MIDGRALTERGFTTVDLVDPPTVADLLALHATLGIDPDDPYWVSSVQPDRELAVTVHRRLVDRVGPAVAELLPGHAPFLAAFITKGRRSGGVGLHPDWTYVDERRFRARVLWCPLVDTDETSGAIAAIPGSHRHVRALRGSGSFPSPVEHIEAELWADHAVTVPLTAGQAVVWDAAVLHGSWPNPGDAARPAVAIAVAPVEAPLVHFHRAPDGPLEGFAIDDRYYTAQPYASRPAGYAVVEPWDEPVRPFRRVAEAVDGPQG